MIPEIILILPNPQGNKKRITNIISRIIKVLEGNGHAYTIMEQWPPYINNYKQVWLIGGDGTLNYFINLYKENTAPIAVFPVGSGNDFSWQVHGSKTIEKMAADLLQGKTQQI